MHNSVGTKIVISVLHPLLPSRRKAPLYSDQPQTERSGGTRIVACDPVRRVELGGLRGRGDHEAMDLGLRDFEYLRYHSVFCFGWFLSSEAFVTDATLRSTARKNCLERDSREKSLGNNLLFFSKLQLQGFGA